jgi:hypothetical protein
MRNASVTRAAESTALWWQIAVFTLALILSARLPKVRLDADGPMIGGA